MAKRIPSEAKLGAVTYHLADKPSYGHGGSSRTPTLDSAGIEVEGAEEVQNYPPRITGLQLIMAGHSLKALQDLVSSGPIPVVLKVRSGNAVETFSLANAKCTTNPVIEQDGVVSLDFEGGTASGG